MKSPTLTSTKTTRSTKTASKRTASAAKSTAKATAAPTANTPNKSASQTSSTKQPLEERIPLAKSKVRRVVKSAKKRVTSEAQGVDARHANLEAPKTGRRRAGRPRGTGKYGESTKAVRFPISLLDRVDSFVERRGFVFRLYSDQIQAGFPSPAEENAPFETLDLGAKLIPNPSSTFFIRVAGESMREAGIFPDDVLIVDRSLEATNGDVVVAAVNGEFTVKRLFKTRGRIELRPENKAFRPIVITEEMNLEIWGVVKTVLHNV